VTRGFQLWTSTTATSAVQAPTLAIALRQGTLARRWCPQPVSLADVSRHRGRSRPGTFGTRSTENSEEWLPGWADELARVDPSFLDGRRPTVEGGSISRCGPDIGRLEYQWKVRERHNGRVAQLVRARRLQRQTGAVFPSSGDQQE
jgi:hypothetical protein